MEFGGRLKILREETGLSREELASKLKVSYSAISKYEINVRFPDQAMVKKIADFFNVSTDYLLGRTNMRNPDFIVKKDGKEYTAAAHRTNGLDEDLPPEAIEEIKKFREYIRHKYGKKENL